MTYGPDGDSVLQRLSGDPGASLTERLRHHGARILLLIALAVFLTALFPPEQVADVDLPVEGAVAEEDVAATIAFSVPKTAAELERDRRLAMEAVPPTFEYRGAVADSVAERLRRLFERLEVAAAGGSAGPVEEILRESRIVATPAQLRYLTDDGTRSAIGRAAQRAARDILPRGVADPSRMLDLTTDVVTIRDSDGTERSVATEEVLTAADFYVEAGGLLPGALPPDAQDLFRLVLISHLDWTLVLDVAATERDRDAARESLPLTKGLILEGQLIVRAGDPIGPETRERLSAYYAQLRGEDRSADFGALLGATLLNAVLLSIFGLLLFLSRPEVYANFRCLLMLAMLTAAYFGAGAVIDRFGLPPEALPIAFVALPVAVLWDTRMALLLVLVLAALTGTLAPFASYGTVLMLMAGGAAGAMSVRAWRRRSDTWVSIALIAGAGALVLMAHGLATGREWAEVWRGAGTFAVTATASALLAVGFLWIFEMFTGITTDQTLLEWADPTRPLLKSLAMEAPGTYAHTIAAANLAEAAATRIEANGLLARVGLLYHDIGKVLRPHYFVENLSDLKNPHDKLRPETSAAIVREHVTEGARLAREAKVPPVVVRFILEHHGTQKIGFFYEKARATSSEPVDLERFSYGGPKPSTKESAIAMLADSCESAARALQDPTPERVRDLIDAIVDAKIADGQLDDAPLTLKEIALVKDQFVTVLSGVVHRRIEYPETKHLTEGEGASEAEAEVEAEVSAADALAAATRASERA
ncbi:MAG: HDIG domain-containing protein [Gemmatimonadetes bacterium]|nr:HDIG domain-containing protein [Gemmatimonadota bacterium]